MYSNYSHYTVNGCDAVTLKMWTDLKAEALGRTRHTVVAGSILGSLVGLVVIAGAFWWMRSWNQKRLQRHGKVEVIELENQVA